MIGGRTLARELALQLLFSSDVQSSTTRDDIDSSGVVETGLADAEASTEVKAFARELVYGVRENHERIDALLVGAADNWELSRLATVDRNILRLAVYEMIDRDDVPTKVSINEAIELGKRFSTAQSGSFINGILDRIRRDLGLEAIDESSD